MRARRASKVARASSKRLRDRYSIARPYQTKGSSFPLDVIFTRNSRRLLLEATSEPLAQGLDAVSWHACRRAPPAAPSDPPPRRTRPARSAARSRPALRAAAAVPAGAAPDFELDVPRRPAPKAAAAAQGRGGGEAGARGRAALASLRSSPTGSPTRSRSSRPLRGRSRGGRLEAKWSLPWATWPSTRGSSPTTATRPRTGSCRRCTRGAC